MTRRRTHTVHRFRVISRCPKCGSKLLSGCSYRSRSGLCIATRDERPMVGQHRVHTCRRGTTVVLVYDLPREARRIFGDDIAPGIEIGVGE